MVIFRNRLFNEGYLKEDSWINLVYGYHSKQRLEERSKGSLAIMPNSIKLVRKNIDRAYIENGRVKKFIYKMSYNRTENLYLVVVDGYFVKSLWFRDKNQNRNARNTIPSNTNIGADYDSLDNVRA